MQGKSPDGLMANIRKAVGLHLKRGIDPDT
jgi:hypothetical protein